MRLTEIRRQCLRHNRKKFLRNFVNIQLTYSNEEISEMHLSGSNGRFHPERKTAANLFCCF
jgi:hypothetical protein